MLVMLECQVVVPPCAWEAIPTRITTFNNSNNNVFLVAPHMVWIFLHLPTLRQRIGRSKLLDEAAKIVITAIFLP
jgi:hypothetical protein